MQRNLSIIISTHSHLTVPMYSYYGNTDVHVFLIIYNLCVFVTLIIL